jgi:hypothetical protein
MKLKTFCVMVGIFALATTLVASSALAQGRGQGGKPPGVGEEETAGNNLSVPVILVPDVTVGPVLRVPCGTYAVPGADGVPSDEFFLGYWRQKTEATWSADCATALSASVQADWGDNLTSRPNLPAGKPVRVEVSLLDTSAIGMKGFTVQNLTPELADRLATYGTRGEPLDAFTTGDTGAPNARVFDDGATLTIEKLASDEVTWEPYYGPTEMTAEINSTGNVIYGYGWGIMGKASTPTAGKYRLTFNTVNTTITGISDSAAPNTPGFNATSTWVIIELTQGGGGGGKGKNK